MFQKLLETIPALLSFLLKPSNVMLKTVSGSLSAEAEVSSEEPVKKKHKSRNREAASQRLLAIGQKIKHVTITG